MQRKNNYSRRQRTSGPRHNNTQSNRRGASSNHRRGGSRKQYINPERFINRNVVAVEAEGYAPEHKFSDFGLPQKVADNVAAAGYSTPSAIQDQAIPLALDGKDLVGLASTGTGKTAAFLLPILSKLFSERVTGSALVMAPTRELAQQIEKEFQRFAVGTGLYSTVCVGGANINQQIRSLRRRPHVIIGTPGRLKDLIERRVLDLSAVSTLVLDEADRMLDMGFVHDIRAIASQTPTNRQTLCFSATMTASVRKIIDEFANQPATVSVKASETSEHIFQDVVRYSNIAEKRDLLAELLDSEDFARVVVFGETKFGVQRLADNLSNHGIPAAAIHGNKSQSQRERALRQFKNQQVNVLVATDVAARGLDIPDVSHVINYDTPTSYDDYVHRIGRTGRAGKTGHALTFVQA